MNESTQGIIIFTTITVMSSILWHTIFTRFSFAVIGSVITAAVAFQISNYLHIGYLDPFFIIAMAVSAVIATFASVAIGFPYYVIRKRKRIQIDKSK